MTKLNSAPRAKRRTKADIDAAVVAGNAASADLGKQRQAAEPKKARPAIGAGFGKQKQSDDTSPTGKQGEGASGKSPETTELRGGTKQVLITTASLGSKPGRPALPEDYPFGMLEPAKMVGDEIIGPSFFIPESDKAEGKLAAARKRHKALFWSRSTSEQVNGKGAKVPGLRIWRGTPELTKANRR
jgi:hypothetical protein